MQQNLIRPCVTAAAVSLSAFSALGALVAQVIGGVELDHSKQQLTASNTIQQYAADLPALPNIM